MKKLLLVSLLSLFIFIRSEAQETPSGKSKSSFKELNTGFALIGYDNEIYPGASFLWGRTYINENNFIFEHEVGFAFPSIITGKLGIGKKINNTEITMGVRPLPFNLYLQSSLKKKEKGYWIVSIEFDPFYSDSFSLFGSRAILNFGYRWHITKK